VLLRRKHIAHPSPRFAPGAGKRGSACSCRGGEPRLFIFCEVLFIIIFFFTVCTGAGAGASALAAAAFTVLIFTKVLIIVTVLTVCTVCTGAGACAHAAAVLTLIEPFFTVIEPFFTVIKAFFTVSRCWQRRCWRGCGQQQQDGERTYVRSQAGKRNVQAAAAMHLSNLAAYDHNII